MRVYIIKKKTENDFFLDGDIIVGIKNDDGMMYCLPYKVYLMEGHYEIIEEININQLN